MTYATTTPDSKRIGKRYNRKKKIMKKLGNVEQVVIDGLDPDFYKYFCVTAKDNSSSRPCG